MYTLDDFAVTLWIYYEPMTPHLSPVGAKALERLHAGMRKVDVATPRFTDRIAEAEEVVANPDLSPELADADRVAIPSPGQHLGAQAKPLNLAAGRAPDDGPAKCSGVSSEPLPRRAGTADNPAVPSPKSGRSMVPHGSGPAQHQGIVTFGQFDEL